MTRDSRGQIVAITTCLSRCKKHPSQATPEQGSLQRQPAGCASPASGGFQDKALQTSNHVLNIASCIDEAFVGARNFPLEESEARRAAQLSERGALARLPWPGRWAGLQHPSAEASFGQASVLRGIRQALPGPWVGERAMQAARKISSACKAASGHWGAPSSASPARLGPPREAAAEGAGAPGSALRYAAPGFGGSPSGAPIASPSLTLEPSGAASAQPSAGVGSRSHRSRRRPLPRRPGPRLGGASAGNPEAP